MRTTERPQQQGPDKANVEIWKVTGPCMGENSRFDFEEVNVYKEIQARLTCTIPKIALATRGASSPPLVPPIPAPPSAATAKTSTHQTCCESDAHALTVEKQVEQQVDQLKLAFQQILAKLKSSMIALDTHIVNNDNQVCTALRMSVETWVERERLPVELGQCTVKVFIEATRALTKSVQRF